MQVFVDMSSALDEETGEPGGRPILQVDWHPQPEGDRAEPGPGRLHPVLIKGSPEAGLPLRAAPAVPMPATVDDPRVFEGFEARFNDGALEDAEAAVGDLWPEEGHHVGGHPLSTQGAGVFATAADGTAVARDDPRMEDPARQGLTIHDRVLLHVGFDDHVSWGDAGQLNVLIPEADLISRNFPAARAWFDGA